MRTHFNTSVFPELWKLIKEWVKIADPIQFYQQWAEIQANTSYPKSVVRDQRGFLNLCGSRVQVMAGTGTGQHHVTCQPATDPSRPVNPHP